MSGVYRVAAPARTSQEYRQWLAGEELAAEVEVWLRESASAGDEEFAARWSVLRRCLMDVRDASDLARRTDTDLAGARRLLVEQTAALAQVLVRASTQLAAFGVARRWTGERIVASQGSLSEAEHAAVRAERATRRRGRPGLRSVEVDELVLLWDALCLSSRGRWVDLGSGDGRSLARIAAAASASELIGTDVAWSYTVMAANYRGSAIDSLPPRTRYVVYGPAGGPAGAGCEYVQVSAAEFRHADVLAETMRRTLGPRSASVATLLFPLHMPQATRAGPARSAAELMLETATALLGDGGVGLVVTENREALRKLGLLLLGHRRVAQIEYTTRPLSAAQLQAMGIEPYTPSAAELDAALGARFTARAASHAESFRPVAPFAWGFPLLYTVGD